MLSRCWGQASRRGRRGLSGTHGCRARLPCAFCRRQRGRLAPPRAFRPQTPLRRGNGRQFKRLEQDLRAKGEIKLKHAMHLIRLLRSGITALETGELVVRIPARRRRVQGNTRSRRHKAQPWMDAPCCSSTALLTTWTGWDWSRRENVKCMNLNTFSHPRDCPYGRLSTVRNSGNHREI